MEKDSYKESIFNSNLKEKVKTHSYFYLEDFEEHN